MKTARFLFTIVGSGALTLGLSYAGESSTQPTGQATYENHATSDRPADHARGKQVGPTGEAKPTQGHIRDRPKQVAKSYEGSGGKRGDNTQTKRASANDLQQPGLKRAATATDAGLMMNKIENRREPLIKLPVIGGTTTPAPGVVRSRSTTAAVIGGLAASSARNSTAGINGTTIKHRPY